MTTPVLCIYHGNCADGFTAAWVLHTYFSINEPDREVEFFAADYPKREVPDVAGKEVYVLDYSYSASVMIDIAHQAKKLTWIDHHKSNAVVETMLLDYQASVRDNFDVDVDVDVYFSLDHSGAMLTWEWFNTGSVTLAPTRPCPRLVTLVEDRDMWWFRQAETKWFSAVLFSYPYDFSFWESLAWMIERPGTEQYRTLMVEGEAILRKQAKDISELLRVTTRPMKIDGHLILAANLPYTLASDAAYELAKGEPFGAVYYDTKEGRCFALRSDKDGGADVAVIAKKFGGGGHKNAAGFVVPFDVYHQFEV